MQLRSVIIPLALGLGLFMGGAAVAAGPAQIFPGPVYVTVQNASAVEVLPQGTVWGGLDSAHYDALSPTEVGCW